MLPRKEIKIPVLGLKCFDAILSELSGHAEFADYDFSTLTLTVKKKKAPPYIRELILRSPTLNVTPVTTPI